MMSVMLQRDAKMLNLNGHVSKRKCACKLTTVKICFEHFRFKRKGIETHLAQCMYVNSPNELIKSNLIVITENASYLLHVIKGVKKVMQNILQLF